VLETPGDAAGHPQRCRALQIGLDGVALSDRTETKFTREHFHGPWKAQAKALPASERVFGAIALLDEPDVFGLRSDTTFSAGSVKHKIGSSASRQNDLDGLTRTRGIMFKGNQHVCRPPCRRHQSRWRALATITVPFRMMFQPAKTGDGPIALPDAGASTLAPNPHARKREAALIPGVGRERAAAIDRGRTYPPSGSTEPSRHN